MSRLKQSEPMVERLVILEHGGKTAEILNVRDIDHQRLLAESPEGERVIPLQDLEFWVTREGRLWVLNAPETFIQETKHLAMVENALVIGQAVQYQRPGAAMAKKSTFTTILPWMLVLAALLFAIMKK